MKNRQISYFKNFKYKGEKSLQDVLRAIRSGEQIRNSVAAIRTALSKGEKRKADELKKQLIAVTFSGKFKQSHKDDDLEEYTQLIILDFDKIPIVDINRIKEKIKSIPYTFSVFISPSGRGLKVLVKVSTSKIYHKRAFDYVSQYYSVLAKLPIDKSGCNIGRLCYLSHDLDIYVNPKSLVYDIAFRYSIDQVELEIGKLDLGSYEEGNRNNFIFKLACESNRYGLSKEQLVQYLKTHYNHEDFNELVISVESAYKTYKEFGNKKHLLELDIKRIKNSKKFISKKTKFIDNENLSGKGQKDNKDTKDTKDTPTDHAPSSLVLADLHLPQVLRDALNLVSDISNHSQDVFFLSALTISSAAFFKVQTTYRRVIYKPMLFCFVIAPSGSGKGSAEQLEVLVRFLRNIIGNYYKYNVQVGNTRYAIKPQFSSSGDVTSAALIKILGKNKDVPLLIYETESVTFANANNGQFGSFTSIFTKSFSHASIESLRSSVSSTYIPKSYVATLLTGTPDTIFEVIGSPQTGLLSRLIVYTFDEQSDYVPDSGYEEDKLFSTGIKQLGLEIERRVNKIGDNNITFQLTSKQLKEHRAYFKYKRETQYVHVEESAIGIINRMQVISIRIAMIFAVYENETFIGKTLHVSDQSWKSTIEIVERLIVHSMHIYKNLKTSKEETEIRALPDLEHVYRCIPTKFSREEIRKCIQKYRLKVNDRKISRWLKKLVQSGLIIKNGKNHYEKIK